VRIRVFCLVLLLAGYGSLAEVSAAGRSRALGSVVQANNSHVDNQNALAGGDLYACDVLDTDSYGTLRAQFDGSQILLAPSSEVVLDGKPDAVRVIIISGTTTFSAPSSSVLEIDTPAGVLRQSGQLYSGTVNVPGPKEVIISANRSDLSLRNGGALYTVPAGKSARVTFDRAADPSCHDAGEILAAHPTPSSLRFVILGAAVIGGVGTYGIWRELQESETKPDEW